MARERQRERWDGGRDHTERHEDGRAQQPSAGRVSRQRYGEEEERDEREQAHDLLGDDGALVGVISQTDLVGAVATARI